MWCWLCGCRLVVGAWLFAWPGALSPQIGWVWAIYWGFKAYGPLGEGGEL